MYSVIDLFAGAGGLSLGFQQAEKYEIKVAYENNPAMQETYRVNHPGVDVRGDVRSADYSEIQKEHGTIDVVIGGPPCQGFSNANRQRNHAISHNNSLVKEYIRAILEIRPKAFVMENVSMLRSDVHRFYLSNDDLELIDNNLLDTKTSVIPLLDKAYFFDKAEEYIKDINSISQYLWEESDYIVLNVIYKAAKNSKKLIKALEKHEIHLKAVAAKHLESIESMADTVLKRADNNAFSAVQKYYDKKLEIEQLISLITPSIMYQRMFMHSLEIINNNIVVDEYSVEDGIKAKIRSFAVFDYLKALLGTGKGKNGYSIDYKVLNAADFGAPQKRMRFVIMGIRDDISKKVELPQGSFDADHYRTVRDAFEDLEDAEPVFNTLDDVGIQLGEADKLSDLARELRDSDVIMNHIITKTTKVAMERFKALRQGENFHALSESLKTNTYTNASRTQNTIYLRLDYEQPSGTVVNVRKSMWIHPVKNRAVSVREAARLQTFPDSFVFMGSKDKQYQQVGNAVPPFLAKAIADKLAKQLEEYTDQNG